MSESALRDDIALLSRSLFERGFSVGSAGNISVAVEDGLLITPTNSCLGFLEPGRISKVDRQGRHISGDPPSKEIFLHRAFYETRPGTGADLSAPRVLRDAPRNGRGRSSSLHLRDRIVLPR